jgi:L-asparaginase/Glu-tRNA(Gln) amidotransferase subunit D
MENFSIRGWSLNMTGQAAEHKEIGILVTHGTDTLAWTLPYIRYALKNFPHNVCLTGSQFPMEKAFAWSDGFQNIHGAVRFLSRLEPAEVFAVFNNGSNAFSDSLAKVERWRGSAFIGDPIATMEWDEVQHRTNDARIREAVVLDELHVITTGGTIESAPESSDNLLDGLLPGKGIVEEFLRMSVKGAFEELLVHSLCQIDSAEINLDRMQTMAKAIFCCSDPKHRPEASLDSSFSENVCIKYCDPFTSAENYCRAVDSSDALILAGYGGGNANADQRMNVNALAALELANQQEKLFVLSSQVPIGPADFIYKTATRFIKEGALSGVDLSLPECQLRLMYIEGHRKEIIEMASRLNMSAFQLKKILFMSGMKFRNAVSKRNFILLSGDTIPLIKEDILVGKPFDQIEFKIKEIVTHISS